MREFRGESLFSPVKDYVVVDIETTGFDPQKDDIIEIAALRVRDYNVIEEFSTLVKTEKWINPFIENLTGITNVMVANSPEINDAITDLYNFISDDPIVGHNVSFDINFLYDRCIQYIGKPLMNDYFDTMRIAKLYVKGLPNYRLSTISTFFKCADHTAHRALNDCYTTQECYLHLLQQNGDVDVSNYIDVQEVIKGKDSPYYNVRFTFKGSFAYLSTDICIKIVQLYGAKASDIFYSGTKYLVLSERKYNNYLKNLNGQYDSDFINQVCEHVQSHQINVLSEFDFYKLFGVSVPPMESMRKIGHLQIRAKDIVASASSFDETHPLFGRVCVFTGSLQIPRNEAMQKVVDFGGICSDTVTAKTNFLILGNNEYCPTIKDGKSTKQKKAEELRLKGFDIEVISENVFCDLLSV